MSHRNPYCQASSPYPGPSRSDTWYSENLEAGRPRSVAITLNTSEPYANGHTVVWASSQKEISKILTTENRWNKLQTFRLPGSLSNNISGAYTVLDHEGVLYVPRGSEILAVSDSIAGNPYSAIKEVRRFHLPSTLLRDSRESIIGLNLLYDGYLCFVTNHGIVGALSRDFKTAHYYSLPPEEEISNSIAVDEQGGIYIVTNDKMYRVDWTGSELKMRWAVSYLSTTEPLPGRLGVGSGTTPTLMGFGDRDKLVAIADGQRLMNIVAYWRDQIPSTWKGLPGEDRRIAGIFPLKFGNATATKSVTEQSLLVRGYEMIAVNNDYGNRPTGTLANYLTILSSNRIAPKGVEKVSWNPQLRQLVSSWANRTVSCPNGIPSMSSATGLFYCVGAHKNQWTIEALDWVTGEWRWRKSLGRGNRYNSFYAATEIGWDENIISGTLGAFLTFP